jgi:hypothetical protein
VNNGNERELFLTRESEEKKMKMGMMKNKRIWASKEKTMNIQT